MKLNKANWPAPAHITAVTTTRLGGFSQPPFDSNNLGLHVGDLQPNVLKNRQQIQSLLKLPAAPVWLEQTHSTRCIVAGEDQDRKADAAISRSAAFPLAVMTADCLPIALCNQQGTEIAMIHAGWRGLVNGIIENTLKKLQSENGDLLAWIGPAICQNCFEVGDEVYQMYLSHYPFSKTGFQLKKEKWLVNLPLIAEQILYSQGISAVYQSNACTFELKTEYYSYRRDQQTGRMATFIWFNQTNWD